MNETYSLLVEHIKHLTIEEKEELRALLDKLLTEARRDEILDHYRESRAEQSEGKLRFSNDVATLKESLR